MINWIIGLCSSLTLIIVVFIAFTFIDSASSKIWVINQGSVLEANRAENNAQKDYEVIDHCSRFHELFFNLAPTTTTINQTINRALEMADKSALAYHTDLKEKKYYSRLIDINATQQIKVDSVQINLNSYPYRAKTFATIYVVRPSNVSTYQFESSCKVTEVTRTQKNPHGLFIQDFFVNRFELIETQNRR